MNNQEHEKLQSIVENYKKQAGLKFGAEKSDLYAGMFLKDGNVVGDGRITPELAQILSSQGYVCIFPAELSEEAVSKMTQDEREYYNLKLGSAIIVKEGENGKSLPLLEKIEEHYTSLGRRFSGRLNTKVQSSDGKECWATKTYLNGGVYKEGSQEQYSEMLKKVGDYSPIMFEDGTVIVDTDEKMPPIQENKLEKIAQTVKGRLGKVFDKVTSLFKRSKSKEEPNKENDGKDGIELE